MKVFEMSAGEPEVYIALNGKDGKQKLYELESSSKKFTVQLTKPALSKISSRLIKSK